jgi:hypothetical protein
VTSFDKTHRVLLVSTDLNADNSPSWVVHETNDGTLGCDCGYNNDIYSPVYGVQTWCAQIQKVLKERLDAEGRASVKFNDISPHLVGVKTLPTRVVVPFQPTKKFWTNVVLDEPEGGGFRKAVLVSGRISDGELLVLPDPPLLGYIGPGEGRLDLRDMIFGWLRSQVAGLPECQSRSHSLIQWSLRATPQLQDTDWRNIWLLLTKKICYGCLSYVADTAQDAPVL